MDLEQKRKKQISKLRQKIGEKERWKNQSEQIRNEIFKDMKISKSFVETKSKKIN